MKFFNEEPGHSAQETLSISALFVGTYGEFSKQLHVILCPLFNIETRQFKMIQSEVLHLGHTNIFQYIHILFKLSYVQSSLLM